MNQSGIAPMVLVGPPHRRPPATLVERFGLVPTATVGDAQERLWVMDGGIGPMWRGADCVGTALTVYTRAGDNLAVHRALDRAQPGDVLVVNGLGDRTRALVGGLLATRARNTGLAGIVLDGAVRDLDELGAIGLPVFARAAAPAGPYKNGPAEIGFPVACGGLAVSPGDVVRGDADGVAVVPHARAHQVADAVDAVSRQERDLARQLSQSN